MQNSIPYERNKNRRDLTFSGFVNKVCFVKDQFQKETDKARWKSHRPTYYNKIYLSPSIKM